MLAPSSSLEAGVRLRAKRERLHLSIRRVAKISQKIAHEKNDPAFFVPHNWISDIENGKSKPRLLPRFHSLSLIYDCDINEILAAFGLNIADLGNERGHISLPHTHLSGLAHFAMCWKHAATSPKLDGQLRVAFLHGGKTEIAGNASLRVIRSRSQDYESGYWLFDERLRGKEGSQMFPSPLSMSTRGVRQGRCSKQRSVHRESSCSPAHESS